MGSDDEQSEVTATPAPAFYAELGKTLSQGDIVFGVPIAIFEHPLTLCRPGGKVGQGWFKAIAEANAPFAKGKETIHATAIRGAGLGIVVWEDCQIDKWYESDKEKERWFVGIAPVLPLEQNVRDAVHRQPIREGRKMAFFPLPANAAIGLKEDHYVDLKLIAPVRWDMVADGRSATLSPIAKAALQAHLFKFQTAKAILSEIECPACKAKITAEHFLQDYHD